jgi:thiol-disulfide isomerase/thioredoxin
MRVVWLLALCACAHAAPVGPTAPDFFRALPRDRVGPVAFHPEALPGKVVLISFTATWCFPCLADMPTLEKLAVEHPHDLAVVLVALDLDGRMVLEPFAAAYPTPFPLLVGDAALRDGTTAFGRIRELPTRFLFGKRGELIDAWQGVGPPEKLLEAIKLVLARQPRD